MPAARPQTTPPVMRSPRASSPSRPTWRPATARRSSLCAANPGLARLPRRRPERHRRVARPAPALGRRARASSGSRSTTEWSHRHTGSPQIAALFNVLADHGRPVKIHNDGPDWDQHLLRIARDHPRLPIIIAHAGLGHPMVEGARIAAEADNIYAEMCSSFAQLPAVREFIRTIPADSCCSGRTRRCSTRRSCSGTYQDAGIPRPTRTGLLGQRRAAVRGRLTRAADERQASAASGSVSGIIHSGAGPMTQKTWAGSSLMTRLRMVKPDGQWTTSPAPNSNEPRLAVAFPVGEDPAGQAQVDLVVVAEVGDPAGHRVLVRVARRRTPSPRRRPARTRRHPRTAGPGRRSIRASRGGPSATSGCSAGRSARDIGKTCGRAWPGTWDLRSVGRARTVVVAGSELGQGVLEGVERLVHEGVGVRGVDVPVAAGDRPDAAPQQRERQASRPAPRRPAACRRGSPPAGRCPRWTLNEPGTPWTTLLMPRRPRARPKPAISRPPARSMRLVRRALGASSSVATAAAIDSALPLYVPGWITGPPPIRHIRSRRPATARDHEAVGHRLGEGRQVRRDAEQLLGAARPDPEARHDLVEDQDDAVAGAHLAEALEEARPGRM